MNSFEEYLLDKFSNSEDLLMRAMQYAVFPGGKRLRSSFLIEAFRLFMDEHTKERGEAFSYPMACAIELIHSYSLVHDDLPAMDDDDFRRGRPSAHKEFGEGMAILAGDGLLNIAYEIMIEKIFLERDEVLRKRLIKSSHCIAQYAGHRGMIGGQAIDITHLEYKEDELLNMMKLKTACLIMASIEGGIFLGNPSNDESCEMKNFAYSYGMAFQIADDIDDYKEDIGKKATFATCFGVDKAKAKLFFYINEALSALDKIDRDTSYFKRQIDRLNG